MQSLDLLPACGQLLFHKPFFGLQTALMREPELGQELQTNIPDMIYRAIEPFLEDLRPFRGKAEDVLGRQGFLAYPFVAHETLPFQADQERVDLALSQSPDRPDPFAEETADVVAVSRPPGEDAQDRVFGWITRPRGTGLIQGLASHYVTSYTMSLSEEQPVPFSPLERQPRSLDFPPRRSHYGFPLGCRLIRNGTSSPRNLPGTNQQRKSM